MPTTGTRPSFFLWSALSDQDWGTLRQSGGPGWEAEGKVLPGAHLLSLLPQVIELPVTERQIEREHLIQLRRWQETRGELQYRSPPRLHGAKAILEAEPGPRPTLQPSPSIRLPPDAPLPGSKGKPKPHKQIQKEQQKQEKASRQLEKTPMPGQEKVVIAGGDACPPQDVPLKDPVPQDSAPLDSAHHCSKESLTSQESEDTYL